MDLEEAKQGVEVLRSVQRWEDGEGCLSPDVWFLFGPCSINTLELVPEK